MEKICGIYTITNLVNGKIYLGQGIDINYRWKTHLMSLRKGRHRNIKLQNSWNKYGEDNFIYELLIECEELYLNSEEHYWSNLLYVHEDRYGYNIRPTNPYGAHRHSEESKLRMSIASKGKNLGRKLSEDTKKKISESNKGNKISELNKEIARQKCIGKIGINLSEEHKNKIRQSHIGKKRSIESRKNMSLAQKGNGFGRKMSEDTKKKISDTMKNRKNYDNNTR
jgi:group I intron endonuclease